MEADILGNVVLKHENPVILGIMKGYTPPLPPPSIPELVKKFVSAGTEGSFHDFLTSEINESVRVEIFKKTKKQHRCQYWKQQRIGALTASILHKAARYEGDIDNNYIVKIIMGDTTFAGNSATRYGTTNELVAKKLCEKLMKRSHKGVKAVNSGLMIWENNPLIRASPDGIVSCKCCGKGTLEIKCPASIRYKNLTGVEIARDGSYHLELRDGKPKLKRSAAWYTQIQVHLGVSKFSWCDFIMFTQAPPHIFIKRILFDEEVFHREVDKALAFHEKFVMPRLFSKHH